MYSRLMQVFLLNRRLMRLSFIFVFLVVGNAKAVETNHTSNITMTDLVITKNKGSELRLEARQMPLASVLGIIANKTNTPIHYSVLPEGLVTATCVGSTLKQVLECLLNGRADIIFRYPNHLVNADSKTQVAEAWVLGSKIGGVIVKDCQSIDNSSLIPAQNQPTQGIQSERQIKDLLDLAQSGDSEERARAIGALLSAGHEGNTEVKATLEQALNDHDANVRAQAISTYAHREGSAATDAIQQALQDSSVDVRLMAVDGITENVDLLQQATTDSNEAVRNLAFMKLEELNTNLIK